MIEAGFAEGRNMIVVRQIRVDYETKIPGKVNWCQTNISSKWKRMTRKFGKLTGRSKSNLETKLTSSTHFSNTVAYSLTRSFVENSV